MKRQASKTPRICVPNDRPRLKGTGRVLALLAIMFAGGAWAQSDGDVVVGLYESPPFVMLDDAGAASGMAIDLWEILAEPLGLGFEYRAYATLSDLTDAVESGASDVAVTNLTITRKRAETIDFTQPWFDAGLRIMVADAPSTGLRSVIAGLASAGYLRAYGWLALTVMIATVLLTMFDRRFDGEFPRRWRDGIADSFYSVMSVATSGRIAGRKNLFGWAGRIVSAFWLVCGIAVLAYVTSSVTSVMTTLAITDAISGPEDLPGKTVGVFEGSVAEQVARDMGLRVRTFDGIAPAAKAIADGRIDAMIADAPVLEYFAHSDPAAGFDVVGQIFEPDKYGFGVTLGGDLTKRLTVGLLGLKERGVIDELRATYFGSGW